MSNKINVRNDCVDSDGNITISYGFYLALQADSRILAKLYAAGVDNWEGYEEALGYEPFPEEEEEDE
jgi:hypothetical protein